MHLFIYLSNSSVNKRENAQPVGPHGTDCILTFAEFGTSLLSIT